MKCVMAGKDKDRQSSSSDREGKVKKKRHSKDVSYLSSDGEVKDDVVLHLVDDTNIRDLAKRLTKTGKADNSGNIARDGAIVSNECDVSFDGKQKKKKRNKADLEINGQSENGDIPQKRHKKKKKEKTEDSCKQKGTVDTLNMNGNNGMNGEVLEEDIFEHKSKKNKKKKKCKDRSKESSELSGNSQKKHRNKRVRKEGIEESAGGLENQTETITGKQKKKKRRCLHDDKDGTQEKCVHGSKNSNGRAEDKEEMNSSSGRLTSGESTGRQFGQWSSADLGTEDRRQKFLRLLGGFKEPGTSQQQTVQMKLVNIAMGSISQASYMNKLEDQFEKARDISIFKPKGMGLGYEPIPGHGTKLCINPSKSKSIKFDD